MGVQSAIGGAVYVLDGNPFAPDPTSTISDSLFFGNEANAGTGGGPSAVTGGGAVGYSSTTPLNVNDTEFLYNQTVGSRGQNGGAGTEADGGALWIEGSVVTIQGGLIAGNSVWAVAAVTLRAVTAEMGVSVAAEVSLTCRGAP